MFNGKIITYPGWGANLKALRLKAKLSQDQLAKKLNTVKSYICSLELERVALSADMLDRYEQFFQVSREYLTGCITQQFALGSKDECEALFSKIALENLANITTKTLENNYHTLVIPKTVMLGKTVVDDIDNEFAAEDALLFKIIYYRRLLWATRANKFSDPEAREIALNALEKALNVLFEAFLDPKHKNGNHTIPSFPTILSEHLMTSDEVKSFNSL